MKRLTVYSRPGCHLCEQMKAIIAEVLRDLPRDAIVVDEVDISSDTILESRYGHEVPVLTIDGHTVAKYRITGRELRARLGVRS